MSPEDMLMKTRFLLSVAALALASAAHAQSYDHEDFFPLTPGSYWVYNNGHAAYVAEAVDSYGTLSVTISNRTAASGPNPGYLYLRADSAQIQSWGFGGPWFIIVDGDMGYTPFLMRPVTLGRKWTHDGTSNGYPVHQDMEVTSVDMPVEAGGVRRQHCAEVTVTTSFPSGYTPGQVKWVLNRYYFLPGVGCVKRVLTSDLGATDVIEALDWDIKPHAASPPTIVSQPESQVAAVGDTARFHVQAVGTAPLRCQWWKNGAVLRSSARVSGTTSTNLTITALATADAGDYFVVVTNSFGSVTSSVASLEVLIPPESFELADYFYPLVAGNRLEFSGTDYDGYPCRRMETVADTSFPVLAYTGRSAPRSYTTNLIRVSKGYGELGGYDFYDRWDDYFSVVDGRIAYWGDDDDSEMLRVDGGLMMPKTVRTGQTYTSGTRDIYKQGSYAGTASIGLSVLGWSPVTVPSGMFRDCLKLRLTLQFGTRTDVQEEWWARDIGPVKHRDVPDIGEERADLTSYHVVLPPRIMEQPRSISVPEGEPASFSVTAQGSGGLRYQWFRDGELVSGETSATLSFPITALSDAGSYRVVVNDDNASATSLAAALTVTPERVPPVLEITSPADMGLVSTSLITVAGKASDAGCGGSGISWVKVNGMRAAGDTASGDHTAAWSRAVPLSQGTNTVRVVAADGHGNATTNLLTVVVDSVRPLLVVTSPAVGQRGTNAVVTASGRASDRELDSVWCSLNEGVWFQPQGTSNWTAIIELTPGTNTLSAFAVDAAGNCSATNRVRFVFVVYSPLTVRMTPGGSVTPNYNGKSLEIGRSYRMTALPGAGFAFEAWADGKGRVLTNRPPLVFTMTSNLVLNASFMDVWRPVTVITYPLSSARLTTNALLFRGTARDNAGVSAVYCRLNRGEWQTASGASSWRFPCELRSGPNHLDVFAADAAGNCSTTNSVSVLCMQDLLPTYWPMNHGDSKMFSGTNGMAAVDFTEMSGGFAMTLQTANYGGDTIYQYSSNRASLLLTGGYSDSTNFSFSPPVVELTETQLAIGGSRSKAGFILMQGKRFAVTVTTTVTSAGTVTVPAGAYNDCRRVTVKVVKTASGRTFSMESHVLAPRVGIIRVGIYRAAATSGFAFAGWADLVEGTVNGVDVRDLAGS